MMTNKIEKFFQYKHTIHKTTFVIFATLFLYIIVYFVSSETSVNRFRDNFNVFIISFFAIAISMYIVPVNNYARYIFDKISDLLNRRGAFSSDPMGEMPKFAIIRVIFGLFLIERTSWVLLYLQPSDFDNLFILAFTCSKFILAVFLTLGLATQLTLVICILVHWQIADFVLGTSTLGNDIAAILSFVLIFTNSGAHLSLDRLIMNRKGVAGYILSLSYYRSLSPSFTTMQTTKLLALFSYWCVCVYSFMIHLNEPAWTTGVAGPLVLTNNFMSGYSAAFVSFFGQGEWAVFLGRVSLWAMLPWYVAILPFVVWGGILRLYILIWGLLFFSLSFFVLQLGWLAHFEFLLWAALFWERRFIAGTKSLHVAYDDRCNLCDRTVQIIKLLDVFRRVELRPVSKNVEWLENQGVDLSEALTDLYGFEKLKGMRASHGYDFYLTLCRNVFLLLPFYPILLVGRLIGGPLLYRYIADRRTRLFGVCRIPSRKWEQTILPEGEKAVRRIQPRDPMLIVGTHIVFLGIAYLLMLPTPYLEERREILPQNIAAVAGQLANAAHHYGIAPIDVFNETDIRMAENWFVLSAVDSDGEKNVIPILNEDGQRLEMHKSDRIYFGHTLRFRRRVIGREGCFFDSFEKQLAYLSESYAQDPNVVAVEYTQYFQKVPDSSKLMQNRYQEYRVEEICTRRIQKKEIDINPGP